MIDAFQQSWSLFANTYLAAWFIAGLLALLGVGVVGQGQIFLGAAMTQAGMLGVSLGLLIGGSESHMPTLLAVTFSVATALLVQWYRDDALPESVVGWIFLFCFSMTLVSLSKSAFGLKEVQERMASTVIGATRADVTVVGAIWAAVVVAVCCYHRSLTLVLGDRAMAAACGIRVRCWDVIMGLVLGISVGFALRTAGMLYVFGFLVLPSLSARLLCRETWQVYLMAPVLAVAGAMMGFVAGNYWDIPQAPLAVLILATVVPIVFICTKVGNYGGTS